MTATVQVPVFPTYLSSDLFTPGQAGRRTIPSIGVTDVQRPPLGGKSWGEQITKYGGIGALSFQGKVNVKDLPVARSHRHFGSGIANFEAKLQPYDVTSLQHSECRLNDQLLPPVGTDTIDPRKCHVGPILQDIPYTTHSERTEMFPRGPNEDNTEGKSPLCETTRAALDKYRKKIYNVSTYGVTYTEPCKERCSNDCFTCTPAISQVQKRPEIPSSNCSSTRYSILGRPKDVCRISKRVHFADQSQDASAEHKQRGRLGGLAPLWPPSAYLLENSFQIKEDLERFPVKTSNDSDQVKLKDDVRCSRRCEDVLRDNEDDTGQTAKGTPGVCSCNSRACPAVICRNTFCDSVCENDVLDCVAHAGAHPTSLCKRLALFEEWKERIRNNQMCLIQRSADYGPTKYASEADDCDVSGYRTSQSKDIDEDTESPVALSSMYTSHLTLSRQPFPINPLFQGPELRNIPLPPVPLSECLLPSGDRIPCRLGLRFKTEAYKRFHAMHPDPVPDLRRPHNERKRYFFYGYHSSAFRG